MIEDSISDMIIQDIKGLLKSFKIKVYDEDSGYGLLRHVLIRRGFSSGQVLVVLVVSSPIFPSKNNFVKALRKLHPEILCTHRSPDVPALPVTRIPLQYN